jgi:hypothetical protein
MPDTSRAFIRASIVYLCLGAILGALMLINRWIPLGQVAGLVRVSHVEMLVVGWLTQLILGVAWWFFPPLKIGLRGDAPLPIRRGQAQRGNEPLFWATFLCLNAGVLLRAVFDPLYSLTRIGLFGVLAGVSGLFMLAAAVAFVANIWGRVRELGRGRGV